MPPALIVVTDAALKAFAAEAVRMLLLTVVAPV